LENWVVEENLNGYRQKGKKRENDAGEIAIPRASISLRLAMLSF